MKLKPFGLELEITPRKVNYNNMYFLHKVSVDHHLKGVRVSIKRGYRDKQNYNFFFL